MLALPLPGTTDVEVWKIWAYGASRAPVSQLYGTGRHNGVAERGVIEYGGASTTIDYPPLMLHVLGACGRVYARTVSPGFEPRPTLYAFVKAPALLAEILTVALLARALNRQVASTDVRAAVLAYWLNPAILLTSVLGYLDPVAFPPAFAALLLAVNGFPFVSGLLAAVSFSLKPQGLLVVPILLIIWVRRGSVLAGVRGIGGAALVVAAVLAPFVAAGTTANLVGSLGSLGRHEMISGQACNIWWLIDYVLRAGVAVREGASLGQAIRVLVRILSVTRMLEMGFPNPRYVGLVLLAAPAALACWTTWRRPHLEGAAAGAGLLACSYFVLSAQVHENHFWTVIPWLILAATLNPASRRLTVWLSLLFALNLAMFYGLGRTMPRLVPRRLGIDVTVPLSVAIIVAWTWFVAIVWRETSVGRQA